jgi:hypothetical protein
VGKVLYDLEVSLMTFGNISLSMGAHCTVYTHLWLSLVFAATLNVKYKMGLSLGNVAFYVRYTIYLRKGTVSKVSVSV